MTLSRVLTAVALWASSAAFALVVAQAPAPYVWDLPGGWPAPKVPTDNPMSAAKVALGRSLFYDTRLSANGTQACATCHVQAHAFADTRGRALGSTGQQHPRGSMSLVNIGYANSLTWSNPLVRSLEDQALVPMYGEHPVELGLKPDDASWIGRLRSVAVYQRQFVDAFGATPDPFTLDNVTRAIASFERSIISARSPYDLENAQFTESAQRGEALYFGQSLLCFRCHGGFTMSGGVEFEGRVTGGEGPSFFNNGLYNLAGAFSYPLSDTGAYEITRSRFDVGRFKAPTLRNIAVTAPYMHDGSIATLDGVLDHYQAGGRTIGDGPYRGVGRNNPYKSPLVRGFALSADDRRDLLAFLNALTDDALLTDQRFGNPWER